MRYEAALQGRPLGTHQPAIIGMKKSVKRLMPASAVSITERMLAATKDSAPVMSHAVGTE